MFLQRISKSFPIFLILFIGIIRADVGKMVCYYNSASEGSNQVTIGDIEPALQFCNFLVYGYAGINSETFTLESLNAKLDVDLNNFRTAQKLRYPHLRILLSVGGGRDIDVTNTESNKYLQLLEDVKHRQAFVSSIPKFLRDYGFDGLDLAWQFPENRPIEVTGAIKRYWHAFKKIFTGDAIVDEKAAEHKEQFTTLVQDLKRALQYTGYYLTLTMLPNVNSALFIDIPAVVPNLDFVNLATFDFQTPDRDPKVADYSASLYETYERPIEHNVNYHVQYWLNNTAPNEKIIIGIPAYGRAWVMSKESGLTGYPPVQKTQGRALSGILSWPQICNKLNAPRNSTESIRKVGDPTKRYGIYAYRSVDDEIEGDGIWISYEDPTSAAIKAEYATARRLGGVALFDLTMDDYKGVCADAKYPILRSIKYKL